MRSLLLIALGLALGGCGYSLGVVRRDGVETIAVPVFANETLRRGFERDLTRAVQREIKESLPYRLADSDAADLILKGSIVAIEEQVLIEGANDQVLEGLIKIRVRLELVDDRGDAVPIYRRTADGRSGENIVFLTDQAEFVFQRGEDRNSATREAIKEISERIVQVLAGPPL